MTIEYAKEVYNYDLGRLVDRTRKTHRVGDYDVDLFAHNRWTYAGSVRMQQAADEFAQKIKAKHNVPVRIVLATTGEVLSTI